MANNLSLLRTDRITGSRIAGVLGISRYVTREDVMREMIREHHFYEPEFNGNWATEFGQEHESDGLAEYELLTGHVVSRSGEQAETLVGGPEGAFAVTPDGVIEHHGHIERVVEVKAPVRALYTSIWERPDYAQQCWLTAELLDVPQVDFVIWRDGGRTIIDPLRRGVRKGPEGKLVDFDWWHSKVYDPSLGEFVTTDTVASECERFLEEYSQLIELPDDHPDVARFLAGEPGYRYDPEWLDAAAAVLELVGEQERIEAVLAKAKRRAIELTPGKSSKGGGLHVIFRKPSGGGAGRVSWKDLAEGELGDKLTPELQAKYRGAPSAGGGPTYAFKLLNRDAK